MAKNEIEIWRAHPEYTEIEVSTLGRVRTLDRVVYGKKRTRLVKGRVLKQYGNVVNGYLIANILIDEKWATKSVHRLVAQTFIPNPDNLPQINHKDCNRTNNNVDNLEWCSRSYNIQYREEFGKASGLPVFAVNLSTLEVSHFRSQGEASRSLGIDVGNINKVIKGKYKQTGGYWFVNNDENANDAIKRKFHTLQSQVLGL